MGKSAEAFRTISEVADWLGVQTHVLRFWESKFSQVKPVKRAGGRRYYRPSDMLLLGGIHKLLRDDGMTIKGVQKVLREQGMAYVSDLSQPLDDATDGALDASLAPEPPKPAPRPPVQEERVVALPRRAPKPKPDAAEVPAAEPAPVDPPAPEPVPLVKAEPPAPEPVSVEPPSEEPPAPAAVPAFMRAPSSAEPPAPAAKPNVIDAPDDPPDLDDVAPAALTYASRLRALPPEAKPDVAALLVQLTTLRDRMASARTARKE